MRYFSTKEAAAILHVDSSRVRMLCKQGRIKTIMIGNTYAISERELSRFAATPRRPGRPRQNGGGDAVHEDISATSSNAAAGSA
jgi:excisionase family DNA binding protein